MDNKNNTYLELNDWTKSVFDNFGRIVLLKHYNNYDKIQIEQKSYQGIGKHLSSFHSLNVYIVISIQILNRKFSIYETIKIAENKDKEAVMDLLESQN